MTRKKNQRKKHHKSNESISGDTMAELCVGGNSGKEEKGNGDKMEGIFGVLYFFCMYFCGVGVRFASI